MLQRFLLPLACLLASATFSHAADSDKTLVSWVALADKNVRAGTVLTVQLGDEFDGIVFAERDPLKWMAGSDFFRRTQQDRSASAPETAGPSELVQMAIVYRDDRITIYRAGAVYADYPADNVDLLSGDYDIAVFGLRHVGGDGSIAGGIEDARVYDEALGAEEIRALRPDVRSERAPYAWWNFEGGEIAERTGRYTHTATQGGARVADGRLILGEGAAVVAASTEQGARIFGRGGGAVYTGPYLPETPEWPEEPPADWLTYHLAHPGPGVAMPGDPNPAYFHNGRYHLHYIYRNRTGFVFAHVSSEDMVRWRWHPTVLAPPTTGHGMFSGTGFFTEEGRPAMIYHGEGSGRNWIAFADDGNLDAWTAPMAVVPKTAAGEEPEMRHWDPDIWRRGDTWYALSGGQDPHLMKSKDLENWLYLGRLLHEDYPDDLGVPRGEDISCANMFPIGGKWMLLCISHTLGARYYLGEFKDEKFLPEAHALMSWNGNHFFAPESMLTEDGRRVMWAWLLNVPVAPGGVQALPRELELPDDGVLRIRPLRELETLRNDKTDFGGFTAKDGEPKPLLGLSGDALELDITFAAPLPVEFGLSLLGDAEGNGAVRIVSGSSRKTLRVGSVEAPFQLSRGEDLRLRVFVDKNLVEVFANDRQAAVYAHEHIRGKPRIGVFTNGGDLQVRQAKAWRMDGIHE